MTLFLLAAALVPAQAAPPSPQVADSPPAPYTPDIAGPSGEALFALKRIRVPAGFRVELFAAEPLLANPVALTLDERGRVYVAETFRHHAGVTDTRKHMYWLDDDLACRSVEDRVALLRKHLGSAFDTYAREHDRVRRLEDRDGDGRADHATVFADGFKDHATGIGSGLLARRDLVWYSCVPDLWRLADQDGDGRADRRQSLQHGYGVHVGYLGHDLHGLILGPDGKLYFTMGDRGFRIATADGVLEHPDSGAVLRCDPDGSALEIVADGLRNPQELAFDDRGDLFTGENNSDGGDEARFLHVVEGADYGWRIGFQFLTRPVLRGVWNAERPWDARARDRPAHVFPPIANITDGPSGLACYPGTGFGSRYEGYFFLCDFRGASARSGVLAFRLRPEGASFALEDLHEFAWSVLATDADFGPDGALYLADWVEGWEQPRKGRIYKVLDPAGAADPAAAEVRRLLGEGLVGRPATELAGLLAHRDRRVRQEAQFTLAERGREALAVLARAAKESTAPARYHGIWGLGQLARREPEALAPLIALLGDGDAEARAQAAKVLGQARAPAAADGLIALLADSAPRVRLQAALALARVAPAKAAAPVIAMARRDAGDPVLRHAAVMALAGIADLEALRAAARDESPSVRICALLALRRLASPEATAFLADREEWIAVEAARAIHDVPIPGALPALARLAARPTAPEPLARRALNACLRLGGAEEARAVAAAAAEARNAPAIRAEALEVLADWGGAPGRDRVLGVWRPIAARPAAPAAEALRETLGEVLTGAPDPVREAAARAAGGLGVKEAVSPLRALAADGHAAPASRAAALGALERLRDDRLGEAVRLAVVSDAPAVRAEGRRILARIDPRGAVPVLAEASERGSVAERQAALAVLAGLAGEEAAVVILRRLEQVIAGTAPLEIELDVLEAARQRSEDGVREKLAAYEAGRPKDDPLAVHRTALAGGNADRGRELFRERADLSCLRCHKAGEDGGAVGPDLTGIGGREKREHLLESLVDPNRKIARGFETVVLLLASGEARSGVLKTETDSEVTITGVDGQTLAIGKQEIAERTAGPSAMPEDLMKTLSERDLRDLVEYLASLR